MTQAAVAPQSEKKSRRGNAAKSSEPQKRRAEDRQGAALRSEVLGLGILALSLALMLALGSFTPADVAPDGPIEASGHALNLIGPVGAHTAQILLYLLGVAAFLLPVTLALPGLCFLIGRPLRVRPGDVVGYPVLVAASAMVGHLWMEGRPVMGHDAGGLLGTHGAELLRAFFGQTGAYLVLYAVVALTFVLTTRVSIVRAMGHAGRPAIRLGRAATAGVGGSVKGARQSLARRLADWQSRASERRAARHAAREETRAEVARLRAERRAAKLEAAEARKAARVARKSAAGDVEAEPVTSAKSVDAMSPASAAGHSGGFSLGELRPEVADEAFALGADAVPPTHRKRARPRPAPQLDEGSGVLEPEAAGAEIAEAEVRAALAPETDTAYLPAVPGHGDAHDASEIDALEDLDHPTAAWGSLGAAPDAEPPAVATPSRPPPASATPPPRAGSTPVVRGRCSDATPALNLAPPELQDHPTYTLPPLEMLQAPTHERVEIDPLALHAIAERLVNALATFKIEGHITEIHPGPVVTMFEFKPAPGVRISRISALSDDLAMALCAQKVRIVAPIPGKGAVGFEIPNEHRETVFLREIIGTEAFWKKGLELPMALGKDIHGRPVVTDLAKMPHLLVAGTTGSGKSVGVNDMITSLLYRYGPEDVRFIMIDPKMLELSIYEGIPHLLLKVVTDAKKASLALKWAVDEMERRYELMMEAGVRNLRGYNRWVERGDEAREAVRERALDELRERRQIGDDFDADGDLHSAEQPLLIVASEEEPPRKLPYLVVVIDEFADLMMVAGKEVEHSVCRIAQKARAAGIHLILATQRPSTDVITGVIKANFPTRMAFRVSSGIDSRTIVMTNGAENLLGKGDMLFLPPGASALTRVHGAFVTEEELHEVVEFIKTQAEPDYLDESVLLATEDGEGEDDAGLGDDDPMYEEAVRVVLRDGRASTSHLQRRLSLGYNRAARMVDQMERDGLVGPANGSKPRDVYRQVMGELVDRWDSA